MDPISKLNDLYKAPVSILGAELSYWHATFLLLCPVRASHLTAWRSTIAFLQSHGFVGLAEDGLYQLTEDGLVALEELRARGYEVGEQTLSNVSISL